MQSYHRSETYAGDARRRLLLLIGVSILALMLLSFLVVINLPASAGAMPEGAMSGFDASLALAPGQEPVGCVEGYKIDDQHFGLPDWVIHAKPAGQDSPVLTAVTDGEGKFRFDDLPVGTWTFWEEMQEGWVPVTSPQFDAEVREGPDCTQIRFKNRQGTPSPTPTPTLQPATRIRGYVLEETCEGRFPLGDVTLTAWRSVLPDDLDSVVQVQQSKADGFWNFVLLPPPPPYYHVILAPPPGLEIIETAAPEGEVVAPDHIRFTDPKLEVYMDNLFVLRDPDLICGTPTPTPTHTPTLTPTPTNTPTPTVTPTPTPLPYGCVEGHKIDDQHVGLPEWEIHAKPAGDPFGPEYVAHTDGTGYFKFPNLEPGDWRFWEVMQSGWEAVSAPTFTATVPPGPECIYIRFKNRQVQPTPEPTATPTPPESPLPTPTPIVYYLPMLMFDHGDICTPGTLQVQIFDELFIFPLEPDDYIKSIPPLPWFEPTTFRVVNHEGWVEWRQYQPYYVKQIGGTEFVYPGGHPGEEFSLFVRTECGSVAVETEVDDPTPTPAP